MDSPQSVVSPFKKLSVSSETEKKKTDATDIQSAAAAAAADYLTNGTDSHLQEANDSHESIGVLDVYIHQARDIHNICIYHKQDVYAKVCMTSDPDSSVSTQTINGGGQNPVFNQCLSVKVRTAESSLKCEIWMLSRVRNYLEDQLLGFALVPVSEILINKGKLEKEFSMSSTDLFHSPAGFVQLSLSYTGSSPDLMMFSPKQQFSSHDCVELEQSETCEFDNIEFPDPNIACENQMMVSEYFEITANSMNSHCSESLVSSGIENHHQPDSENGEVHVGESFSGNNDHNNTSGGSTPHSKINSPPTTSMSNNGSPVSVPASSQTSSETPRADQNPKSLDTKEEEEQASSHKEEKEKVDDKYTGEHIPRKDEESEDKEKNGGESESESSNNGRQPDSSKEASLLSEPLASYINVELPEEKVVQQDFVDMYMKSMQQFTDSLAKMKLPMDHLGTTTALEDPSTKSSENSSSTSSISEKKVQGPKTPGSRVFYGSRAFF